MTLPTSASTSIQLAKYVVRSSDVISDMRVNVLEEGSERIIWYKERFLTDDEIVESVYDNASSTVAWSVHRPKRGWYIRVRSPSFPPGVFIALQPPPRTAPFYVDGALTFGCRTNTPAPRPSGPLRTPSSSTKVSFDSSAGAVGDDDSTAASGSATVHSYPPTPPVTSPTDEHPPSPRTVHARLAQLSPRTSTSTVTSPSPTQGPGARRPGPPSPLPPPTMRVTQFMLAPHASAPLVPAESPSLLSRALRTLRSHAPAHSYSFTLSPLPLASAHASGAGAASAASVPSPVTAVASGSGQGQGHARGLSAHLHLPHLHHAAPLLTFHDTTSHFNLNSTTGVFELDVAEMRALGVQPSFWIAVALTYLEFLCDREGYIAASAD